MSEGFDEDYIGKKDYMDDGLSAHLKKKEKRCIARIKFSRLCRNRPKGNHDYCEIHLMKFFGKDPDEDSTESDSSTTGKVVFVDNHRILKRRMIPSKIHSNPINLDDSTERYLIHDFETIVDHTDRIDHEQMSIYDYVKMIKTVDSIKLVEKEKGLYAGQGVAEEKDDTEYDIWDEATHKYGAGCVSGCRMEEDFINGRLEKKFFPILQHLMPSKYMDVDMEQELRKIMAEKRSHYVKYGLFSS